MANALAMMKALRELATKAAASRQTKATADELFGDDNRELSKANERVKSLEQQGPSKVDQEQRSKAVDLDKMAEDGVKELMGNHVLDKPKPLPEPETKVYNKNEVTFEMLNDKQREAVTFVGSMCLIGKAGSGKTTTSDAKIKNMIETGVIGTISGKGNTSKYLKEGMPSLLVCSFTNPAVANIKSVVPDAYKGNVLTMHRVLEYKPVRELRENEDGEEKEVKVFRPTFGDELFSYIGGNKVRPCHKLPQLDVVIIEEAGLVSEDLFSLLWSAMPEPDKTTWVFLGDIWQNPSVFAKGILGYMMNRLPVIELTETYRNVGLVTTLALRVTTGRLFTEHELEGWNVADTSGRISLKPIHNATHDGALHEVGTQVRELARLGKLDVTKTRILCPYNVKLGVVELNKYVLQGLTDASKLPIYEIKAGVATHFWSVGDMIYVNYCLCKITKIEPNLKYKGKGNPLPRYNIDRWGEPVIGASGMDFADEYMEEFIEGRQDLQAIVDSLDTGEDNKDDGIKTKQASHIVTVEVIENNIGEFKGQRELTTVGELAEAKPAYCMTVYAFQGLEAKNIICILHESHSALLNMETMYTAFTRARSNLTILYSPQKVGKPTSGVFYKCLTTQKIKGRTLKEKLQSFKEWERQQRCKTQQAEKERRKQAEQEANKANEALGVSTQQLQTTQEVTKTISEQPDALTKLLNKIRTGNE